MPAYVECAKCTFNVLALLTKNCIFLSDTVALVTLLFPFSSTETLTKSTYCWYYFTLVIIKSRVCNNRRGGANKREVRKHVRVHKWGIIINSLGDGGVEGEKNKN